MTDIIERLRDYSTNPKDWDEAADEIASLRDQLAAAQAYGAKLREALNAIASWQEGAEVCSSFDDPGSAKMARGALAATTPDDSALRERLAAERERVIAAAKARYDHEVSAVVHHAKQYDAYDWHMARQAAMADMLDAIRALGDE